jgi:Sortase domain
VVVLVTALVGVAAVLAGHRTPQRAVADTTPGASGRPRPAPAPPVHAATPARRLATLVVPEAPRAVRLPSGRVVPVRAVSTRAGRVLDVPEDIRTAGWWRGGSEVGDPFGSILVAAHIDSFTQGLGPFSALLGVRSGQTVRLTSRHLRQDFVIRSRRLVPQGSLVHQQWLFAATGRPRLTMVTCAPPYDRSRGGYQNLAVVTAVPVSDPVREEER